MNDCSCVHYITLSCVVNRNMKKFLKIKNMRGANKKPLRAGGTGRGLRPAHDSEQFARAAGMGKEGIPARTEVIGSICAVQCQRWICLTCAWKDEFPAGAPVNIDLKKTGSALKLQSAACKYYRIRPIQS